MSLPTTHQPLHQVQDFVPRLQHTIPFRQRHQIVQEYLAEQLRHSDPRLAHTRRIRLVDFRFE